MSEIKRVNIDPFSLCAVPISTFFDNDLLGQASGFFYERAGRLYLVSNWHVFSGREPSNGQPKDQTGYRIPNNIAFSFRPENNPNNPVEVRIKLTLEGIISVWIQHKRHGQKIDVAAIEIDFAKMPRNDNMASDIDVKPLTINGARQTDNMLVMVSSDIFVLGYPLGIMKTTLLPVWKRGSVATELDFDVNDLPCFVIDTATREGMSGAPVIARSIGGYSIIGGGQAMGTGTFNRFLGVYSGRYVGGIDEAHLGIVWKVAVIDQIIDDPTPGDFVTS